MAAFEVWQLVHQLVDDLLGHTIEEAIHDGRTLLDQPIGGPLSVDRDTDLPASQFCEMMQVALVKARHSCFKHTD
jgi:hypothetical protein